jgi:hypothetical protein
MCEVLGSIFITAKKKKNQLGKQAKDRTEQAVHNKETWQVQQSRKDLEPE